MGDLDMTDRPATFRATHEGRPVVLGFCTELPTVPDPLLETVKAEAARVDHPSVRASDASRLDGRVVLRLSFVEEPDFTGLDLHALVRRVHDSIRRDLPGYSPLSPDNQPTSGRGVASELNPPWLHWFSMTWGRGSHG